MPDKLLFPEQTISDEINISATTDNLSSLEKSLLYPELSEKTMNDVRWVKDTKFSMPYLNKDIPLP